MAYDNTMKIEFYKPKYDLDIKFDGDDSFDLLFKNMSGEFYFSADVEDYDAYVSFEDEECKFTNGELEAKVNITDLMETIANGQLRNTNGTTYGEWIPRIVGDYKTEHDLVFDGKTYADRGYWELFFKGMSKDEIKDFIEFCRDYIDIPNLEFSSRDFNFDEKGNILVSDRGNSITINDDYTIEMAQQFMCKSSDTVETWEMNHDYGEDDYDEFEEKKSLKEANNELTWKFNSRNDEYIINSFDCHYDNSSGFVLYKGSNKRIEILFDDLNTLVAKGYAKWTYIVGVGYILSRTSSRKGVEWYSIHTKLYSLEPWGVIKEKKNLKESNFKKSDAKVALQNALKNGEEFDIPFKYSDEWEFTDAIEDELDRQGFSFENSFRDKNYGSVEEYSDELETVYVIMDRSLSSRGICVGLVTEL